MLPSGPVAEQPKVSGRLEWVDQLRTMVIVLVVNMHACVTYSHVGSWYVTEQPEPPLVIKIAFLFWEGHLQSFFMGLLFFIAGYFAYGSLERKGPAGFFSERCFRLGLPTLLYMVILHPLIVFVINPWGSHYDSIGASYARFLYHFDFLGSSGPMWFAAALLLFSAALAALRSLRPSIASAAKASRPPGTGALWAWGFAAFAVTFLVRTVQPVGSSVSNMQLCYFPQYVLAFATGYLAARDGWLAVLARSRAAKVAGWMGLVLGPLALAGVLFAGGIIRRGNGDIFAGGWNLPALGYAAWEQFAGLGLGLGALAFCSGKLNQATRLSRWLSERSFGVYLFHPVILVLATLALRRIDANPFFKVSLLTGAGLVGSFLVADLARRIPGLRKIL